MNMNSANEEEEDDLFYFESDHLALKGNKDYSEVLKAIFILDSQRAKAIKDYDKVLELHKDALKDPFAFVEKLKEGQELGVPDLQIIADVPDIQWSKFKVKLPEEGLKFINEKYNCQSENTPDEKKLHKDTHKKLWTSEEQRRLEELLVIYPPESIELRRFKKIAAALGNRTVKQVSSRVQKYFLKLYKEGLPIPGRVPKYAERVKKSKLHSHQKYNHYLFKPTTFFPHLDIPVVMNEAEPVPGPSTNSTSNPNLLNYLIPESLEPDEEVHKRNEHPKNDIDVQLSILRRVKHEKHRENHLQSNFRHFGYKCDYCNEEPIMGVRWHCNTCETESVDFCSDCVIAQMYTGKPHPLSHRLEVIRNDIESACQSDNSSSDSISGSAFDSSIKNLGSSNDSDNESETEEFSENPDGIENYQYLGVNTKQGLDEEEEQNIKTETDNESNVFEEENCVKVETFLKVENSYDKMLHDESYESNCQKIRNNLESILQNDEPMPLLTNKPDIPETNYHHDRFTNDNDTQNISYSYLHSNLLFDST